MIETNRNLPPRRTTSFSPLRRLVGLVRRYRLLVGCSILIGVLILFWFAVIAANRTRAPSVAPLTFWDAIVAIDANIVGSLFLFLIVFGLLQYLKDTHREEVLTRTVVVPLKEALRNPNESVSVQTDRIDWAALFAGTNEVLLLAPGCGGWEEEIAASIPPFLDRGGKMSALFHDPNELELIETLARRMGYDPNELAQGIRDTVGTLRDMVVRHFGHERARTQFSSQYTKQLSSCRGIYFKPGQLLLSFYPSQQDKNGQSEPPSFLIRTDLLNGVRDWFENEWAYLSKSASEPEANQSRPLRM